MPYNNLPSYGRNSRSRPLKVMYAREVPLQRRPLPRVARPTTPWQPPQPVLVQQPREPRSYKWPVLAVLMGAIFIFALFHNFSGKQNIARAIEADASSSLGVTTTPSKAPKTQPMETYKQTITNLVAAHPGENITVATSDVSDGTVLTLGDQGTYTAASTAKLITAALVLHDVESGKLSLSMSLEGQSVRTLLQNMVVNSDNDAWQILNDYLTHPALKTYMNDLGFGEYDPDANTLKPDEMVMLTTKLYKGELLNKTHTTLLLSYMQQSVKQEYIVQNVPAGYTVYHKAGWLDGLMHDVAIISNGHKTIVLAIYTFNGTSQGDTPVNQDLFKQITNATMQAYF